MPPSGVTPCSRKGAPTIAPTGCRGFSEEYGSWKIIWTSRRIGRIEAVPRCVMSLPSNSIFPEVGSSSRVISRPMVDLPQPDSPTTPRVSPWRTSKSRPSTACTAPVCRCSSPFLMGKCLTRPDTVSRGSGVVVACSGTVIFGSFVSVTASAPSQLRRNLFGPDPRTVLLRHVAGGEVPVAARHLAQLRPLGAGDVVPRHIGVRAARVEGAAGRHVDQAGRGALDRDQPLGLVTVDAGHRAEQPPGVRVLGLVEDLLGRSPLDAPARVHHQQGVGEVGGHPPGGGGGGDRPG